MVAKKMNVMLTLSAHLTDSCHEEDDECCKTAIATQ
jgi:hypothetical protein